MQETYEPYMPPAPKKERTAPLKNVWIAAGIALIVGLGVGGAAFAPDAPEPVVRTETKTVTDTVTVEQTPQSCLTALDSAETIFNYAAKGFGASSRGFNAVSRLDFAGVRQATADMNALSAQVNGEVPSWKRARDACRASA